MSNKQIQIPFARAMAEGDNDTCLELALEGEKLCKAGECTFLIIIVEVVNIQPSANWE